MIKVEKTTLIEMNVQFTEIFDGATIEEATQKAHNQKSPKDNAKVNIASQRFLSAKIKPTSDINNDSRTKTTSGSTSKGGATSEKNV